MLIYNTCTTKAATNQVAQYEILVWIASIILYKRLGYQVKLFCGKDDIPFLKKEHIYELYDFIDSTYLDSCEILSQVNMNKFWSTRKLVAMDYELKIDPQAIYSDTDILMYKDFNFNCDALFWTHEPENPMLYVPWKYLSKPNKFSYKPYENTNDAYNCGIMWFKDKKLFDEYYAVYKNFIIGNPGYLLNGEKDVDNNIFACNAEQRLLKAICDNKNINVDIVSDYDDLGLGDLGLHLFMHKRVWINMSKVFKDGTPEKIFMEESLNTIAECCFKVIKAYDYNLFKFLKEKPYFNVKRLTYYG